MAIVGEKGNVVVHSNGMIECKESGLTEWPLVNFDGRVLYDHPERLTEAERKFVAKTLRAMKRKASTQP